MQGAGIVPQICAKGDGCYMGIEMGMGQDRVHAAGKNKCGFSVLRTTN